MPYIATLPMYDWPKHRAAIDARWAKLRGALRDGGFDAPDELTRDGDLQALWLSPDLLLGETCIYPLSTVLAGHVRYVATPVYDVAGCGAGTYRSVIVRRGAGGGMPPPQTEEPVLPPEALSGVMAANAPASMSGFVAVVRDCDALGLTMPGRDDILWTGSHRDSIDAVAAGRADHAAIDCVTWSIALEYEPAAQGLHVAGWTASRPGLPLITSLSMDDDALVRIRRAVLASMEAVVLDPPVEITRLPDPRP